MLTMSRNSGFSQLQMATSRSVEFLAIKLLAPRRSLTYVHPPAPIAWHGIFEPAWLRRIQRLTAIHTSCLYLTSESDIPRPSCQKPLQIATSRFKTRTSPQINPRHVPKNGQVWRRPVEPAGSNIILCLDFFSTTLCQEGAASWFFIHQKLL